MSNRRKVGHATRERIQGFRKEVSRMNALAFTIPQVAQMLSVSKSTVERQIRRGELETLHIGRSVRIPQASVNKIIKPEDTTPQALAIARSIMEERGQC